MKLLGDNILVKPSEESVQSNGGLIIPDSFQEKKKGGTVISVGPNVDGIEPGEHVLFDESAAQPVEMEGEVYSIVKDKSIYAVL